MNKRQGKKPKFINSIVKNLLLIIVCGALLLGLALVLLNVYTRHGQNVVVPELVNLQIGEASTILKAKGLHAEVIDSIYHREAIPGAIIEQTPNAGNKVKEGRAIYLTIYAKNPRMVTIPELTDFSTRQATALLNSLGFEQISIMEVPAEYSGLVVAVEYRGRKLIPDEKIPAGSPLTLVVTNGNLADSLQIDNQYIIPPGENVPQPEVENSIDDSFF